MNILKSATFSKLLSDQQTKREQCGNKFYSKQMKITIYLWYLLTIILTVLNAVVFLNPYWLGTNYNDIEKNQISDEANTNFEANTNNFPVQSHNNLAYFGLYRYCFKETTLLVYLDNTTNADLIGNFKFKEFQSFYKCSGQFSQATSILNVYFMICTYLIGVACVLGVVCVCFSFAIIFSSPQLILYMCSFIQIVMGILTISACLIYPLGWSDQKVKETCHSNMYNFGKCELKWAYKLAMVQSITSVLLSILSFILATKTYQNQNYNMDTVVKERVQPKRQEDVVEYDFSKNYGFFFKS